MARFIIDVANCDDASGILHVLDLINKAGHFPPFGQRKIKLLDSSNENQFYEDPKLNGLTEKQIERSKDGEDWYVSMDLEYKGYV